MFHSRNSLNRKTIILTMLMIGLVVSCQVVNKWSMQGTASKELDFPSADAYYKLTTNDKKVVALVNGGSQLDLLSYANEYDSTFTLFSLPDNPSCFLTKYYGDVRLPDGELQIVMLCGQGGNGTDTYLMKYNWESGRLEKLAGPLPLGTSGASWNQDQTKAIGYLDSGFASRTLFWIQPGGYDPLDLEIVDGNRSWNLKDDFPKFTEDDTGRTGTTGRAVWSPDGKTIAFFASPNAIGKTGFARFGVEYYLYLMNPETLQYEVVADNIFSPFVLAWSPDSTQIAFIGKHGFWKENGIWLYSVKPNTVTEISKGIFQDIVWRPDGNNSLIAIQCEDFDVCNKIMEYDLTNGLE